MRLNLVDLERLSNQKKVKVPDAVLVRKHFPKFRKRQKNRAWKLKHLKKEKELEPEPTGKKGKKSKIDKKWEHRDAEKKKDYEMFLQELEENAELQEQVNFYKNDEVMKDLEDELQKMTIQKQPKK